MTIDPAVFTSSNKSVLVGNGDPNTVVLTTASTSGNVFSGSTTGSTSSSGILLTSNVSSSSTASLLYKNRTVARPVANLGNTCYINAVLQALAHAPELCLAMDCEPHSVHCPIAAANSSKVSSIEENNILSRSNSFRQRSPSSSPEGNVGGTTTTGGNSNGTSNGSRKSRRGGRRSPRLVDADGVGGSLGAAMDGSSGSGTQESQFCALCEIESHLRRVHDGTAGDRPVAPEDFVHGFFHSVAPWFKLGVQEDSHEFLRLLIDAMQKSCRKARRSTVPSTEQPSHDSTKDIQTDVEENLQSEQSKSLNCSASDGGQDVKGKDIEYPFSLFRGTVESKVVCNFCQATSSTLDPIEDVGLDVTPFDMTQVASLSTYPGDSSSSGRFSRNTTDTATLAAPSSSTLLDLQAAFQRYASAEALDSGYKCEKCGNVGRATKQSRLASIPPILTLHLKRFRYGNADSRLPNSGGTSGYGNAHGTSGNLLPTRTTRSTRSSEVSQLIGATDYYGAGKSGSAKIDGHVKFDPVFDLRPYVTKELQMEHTNMYCRLFAVIVHAGKNSHSGHYIAYVQNVTKNEWYKMDDSRVTPASLQEVLNAEAYMLFYRVVRHPVSVMLEETYKRRLDQEMQAAAEKKLEEAAKTLELGSGVNSVGKKRLSSSVIDECSRSSEEWFRNKTNVPPHLIGVVRKMQDILSDKIELTPNGRTKLLNDCSSSLKGECPVSPRSIISDDDVIGGLDSHRQQIVRFFYELAQQHDTQKNGSNGHISELATNWFTPKITATVDDFGKVDSRDDDDHDTSNEPSKPIDSVVITTTIEVVKPSIITARVVLEEPDDAVGLL